MEKIEQRNALIDEMKKMNETAIAEKRSFTEEEKTSFAEKEAQVRSLDSEIEAEERNEKLNGFSIELPKSEEGKTNMADETRAANFAQTGKAEVRAVLGSGTIAKPTKADGINGLAAVADSIVDDVHAISLSGNGAWTVAYKDADAAAANVTDGNKIGGTGASFDVVSISPAEWGVLDSVSNQVKKMTSVNYLAAVEESALIALRAKAADKIIAAVKASSLTETKTSVALDATYIRNIVLGYRSIAGKGAVCLYLAQADLATLGAVRGTNEKKAVYEISFDEGNTISGTIKDGGTAVKFRVLDGLTSGEQLFGQPGTIDMPMWDNYKIETNEGGEYFQKNLIGVRGVQTANADVVCKNGMQLIKQAES